MCGWRKAKQRRWVLKLFPGDRSSLGGERSAPAEIDALWAGNEAVGAVLEAGVATLEAPFHQEALRHLASAHAGVSVHGIPTTVPSCGPVFDDDVAGGLQRLRVLAPSTIAPAPRRRQQRNTTKADRRRFRASGSFELRKVRSPQQHPVNPHSTA